MNALTLACGPDSPLMVIVWLFHCVPAMLFGGVAVTVAAAAMLR
jgi:hypothetical protein